MGNLDSLTELSIYQQLIQAGIPPNDLDSHESDLYVKVTPESRVLVAGYQKRGGSVSEFVCARTGGYWFELPFAFDPWWQ